MFINKDDHFREFAARLEVAIDRYGDLESEDLLIRQKRQLETLVNLENDFRRRLIKHRYGVKVYKAFIAKIRVENNNLLTCRPYFRERQSICTGPIAKALKKGDPKGLYRFRFNYNFITFALANATFGKESPLRKISKEIERLRNEIVEMNMPLAISQVRLFWSKAPSRAPNLQMAYMDFIQVACEGLMSAIDKFELPKRKDFASEDEFVKRFRVFRAVAIGRMRGNFIESYSQTMVHFWPQDKKKIYRANKLIGKFQGVVDYDKLASEVNNHLGAQGSTSASEIAELVASATVASPPSESEANGVEVKGERIQRFADKEEGRPDVKYEQRELEFVMQREIEKLSMLDRKILKLKGINFWSA